MTDTTPEQQDIDIVPANVKGELLTVKECPSCGARHERIVMTEFRTPRPPWTHWYICPTTKDPAAIALINYDGIPQDVSDSILKMILRAQNEGKGRFMVAAFFVSDGKLSLLAPIYREFPNGDFRVAAQLFKQRMEEEFGPPPPKEMPTAAPGPKVDIFGGN